MTHGGTGLDPRLEAVLDSRRLRERLLHLRYYRDEPPERSLTLGLELSAAALRTRNEDDEGASEDPDAASS